MTLEEYIKNPMGSSVMTNRQVYQQMYSEKWDAIKLKEDGLIKYTLYQSGEDYYVHLKIPSEVVPKFYYDTIVHFHPSKNKTSGVITKTLNDYDVQFYSNDPSFVYTFTHAFKKAGMFIKDLEYKMVTRALTDKAIEKNPKDEIGYVKSLYFAYLEIKSAGLLAKNKWEVKAKPYTKAVWDNTVEHADDKVRKRQEEGEKIAKRERRERNAERNAARGTSKASKTKTDSLNDPNFGKFKRTDFNTIAKAAKNNIQKSVGHFKKTIK